MSSIDWNPIVSGCSMISEGCTNCYAMKMAFRLEQMGQEKYKNLTEKTANGKIRWNGKIKIDMDDKAIFEPLKRKKPTMYFVNSMTDLFHDDVPFEAIDKDNGSHCHLSPTYFPSAYKTTRKNEIVF